MTRFIIRTVKYTEGKRPELIGTLATTDKRDALALSQAISEIQTDKGTRFDPRLLVRIWVPGAGKIDCPPDYLKELATTVAEEAATLGDWWQP